VDLGGGQRLVLVPIPAKGKSFLMGSPDGDPDRFDAEQPQHEVEFTHDWDMGKFEVTVGQFKAFVADNPGYQTSAEKAGDKYTWRSPGFTQTPEHPVVYVSWNDAQDFCSWLSKRTRQKFRLPFEAEWEYCCRAGTTTRYSFGEDPKELGDHAWFRDNSETQTQAVGRKKANPLGLHDLHGNVNEWCQDDKRKYAKEKVTDPQGPRAGENRAFRGGSWHNDAQGCRCANRQDQAQHFRRFEDHGFRVVRSR
jgi:formylglycine-generating enzyme required for sulfatase activity